MNNIIDTLNQRIASRIRTERESRGWSVAELAGRAGVSRGMIHKIERAESSPTATLLGRISGAFGISMSTLIARAEMPAGQLLRYHDQPLWQDPQSGYLRRHLSPHSDIPLDLVHITLPPGSEIPMPAASYHNARQLIWVQEGALIFREGSHEHHMAPGDCLALGPPDDCVFINRSSAPCQYVVVRLNPQGARRAATSGEPGYN
ncbi:helix-turn-helix domain-containing protein [Shimwellia blattae]|uniref:Transcriptional regulator n=1 Tax=Shimwellia blattae (strain ATCC 29907 / DSM 4481 / JCM 1650 / NBRC 105725 / CDC 9005-74) TaxID=630626 RepID=I2B995_SHIBC|nr:XRE family transcriptional regulator [Shimwellia blattae]AFJ47099.1 transcriptional regulator [Shimwellia blattae DSM 4481 = NBRC 105725]GAB80779.1 putative Xre family transcriptional regulator [Shimwellia blattae DSM 4481 = NBRC 105725]VDY64592.1 HTH-type transcriptional regulator sinR [Shimwellia blattae]VEC22700.1 HTH-type transcriptional regulator sinR [Shimwellia blattae]